MRAFRGLVARRADELCRVAGEELGKPRFETMTSEIMPLCAACRWTERRAGRLLRPERVGGGAVWQIGQQHRVVRVPLGRVGIIATWNYPIQLLGIQLVHAVAGGNRVVVKPSERSPATQSLLLDLAEEAGLNGDRLERRGADRDAGRSMIETERFDHVVFTGSTEVGRRIARTLAESLTPSTLELSGCDSAIVLDDADAGLAARSVAFALRLNGGQTCMAPRRAIVVGEACGAFTEALRDECVEDRPLTPTTPSELERCRGFVAEAVAAGGRSVLEDGPGGVSIVADCPVDCALFAGDYFGPAIAVRRAESIEEAVALHRGVPKRLATSVFSGNPARARRLAPALGSTVVTVNDCVIPTAHPGLGIGGIGQSGWGVSRGAEGLLAMTRPVYVSRTSGRVRTPTAPPSDRVERSTGSLVRWLYGR